MLRDIQLVGEDIQLVGEDIQLVGEDIGESSSVGRQASGVYVRVIILSSSSRPTDRRKTFYGRSKRR